MICGWKSEAAAAEMKQDEGIVFDGGGAASWRHRSCTILRALRLGGVQRFFERANSSAREKACGIHDRYDGVIQYMRGRDTSGALRLECLRQSIRGGDIGHALDSVDENRDW